MSPKGGRDRKANPGSGAVSRAGQLDTPINLANLAVL